MQRKDTFFTIIIPVYNLEGYVGRALDSVFGQGLDECLYEVIAVDDGSTDRSWDILGEYAREHANLRIFRQENQGVSVARNHGMRKAEGRYVTFLDGDDEFFPGSLDAVYSVLQKHGVDVLYNYAFVNNGTANLRQCHRTPPPVREYEECSIGELGNFQNGGSVWGGFYKMDFLREKGMAFAGNIKNSEDTIFNYMLYSHNPRMMFTDIRLYMVHVRPGSATRSPSLDRARHYCHNIEYVADYMERTPLTAFRRQYLSMALFHSVGCGVKMLLDQGISDADTLRETLHLDRVPPLSAPRQFKLKKIQFFLLNHCFPLYLLLFKLRNKVKGMK